MLKRHGFLCGVAGTLAALPAAALADDATPKLGEPVTPDINPDLKAHGAIFERRVHRVGDHVYSAVGWSGCNAIMVVGHDGVIIVDTGDNLLAAREVATEFRKITDKPVRAVIYTCFHIDHISGVKGFVTAEDVKAGKVEVIAHDTLLRNVINQAGAVTPILGIRTNVPCMRRSLASLAHLAAWASRLITCRFGTPQKASSCGQATLRCSPHTR